jgi:hypothetical protein
MDDDDVIDLTDDIRPSSKPSNPVSSPKTPSVIKNKQDTFYSPPREESEAIRTALEESRQLQLATIDSELADIKNQIEILLNRQEELEAKRLQYVKST